MHGGSHPLEGVPYTYDPFCSGAGLGLGVKPGGESTFCIYSSPVGNYFRGQSRAIRLQAVRGYSRAAPGGSGGIKAGANYAPAFLVQRDVRSRGYDEALFLDAVRSRNVFFFVNEFVSLSPQSPIAVAFFESV